MGQRGFDFLFRTQQGVSTVIFSALLLMGFIIVGGIMMKLAIADAKRKRN